MLHVLFASAQLWGTWNFYKMYKKQERIIAQKEGTVDYVEGLPKTSEEILSKNSPEPKVLTLRREADISRDGSEIELTETAWRAR